MSLHPVIKAALTTCLFGMLGFGIEYIRPEPGFGIGLQIWLLLPLLALLLSGGSAAILSTVIAAVSLLAFKPETFALFDAAISIFIIATASVFVRLSLQPRYIDSALASWIIVVPASLYYYRDLLGSDSLAVTMVISTQLMSHLIPVMLVQGMALGPVSLLGLKKPAGIQPMPVAAILRAFQVPMVLLVLLVSIDFFTTLSVGMRTELEQQKALMTGRVAMLETMAELNDETFESERHLQEFFEHELKSRLEHRGVSDAETLRIEILQAPRENISPGVPVIVASNEGATEPWINTDWIYHQAWLNQSSVSVQGQDVFFVLQQPLQSEYTVELGGASWSLLASFLFMSAIIFLYLFWAYRITEEIKTIFLQFNEWSPGRSEEIIEPVYRASVDEVGSVRDALQNLIDRFNQEHTSLAQTNAKLTQAFEEITLLREFVSICSRCEKIRIDDEEEQEEWVSPQNYVKRTGNVELSHGLCPSCFEEQMSQFPD